MSWYKNYKTEWKQIIETVASEIKRSNIIVEKDLIQSLFLYELSKTDLPFVFKGGTSLSKIYGIIDRFSEDIDLSMNKKPTDSEKRKSNEIIMNISNVLGLELSNPDMIKTRYNYNKYVFTYESLFSMNRLEIIIETSYYQNVYPVEKYKVNCYIGSFCEKNNIKLPIPFIPDFEISVQTLERTFIDKVFAICDYKIENMEDRDSRHLYDIAKILPLITFDEKLDKLIDDVRDDRMNSKNNPSASLEYNINDMLKEIIDKRFYERDYNFVTKKLLYEDYSYEKAINNGIRKILETNVFDYKKIIEIIGDNYIGNFSKVRVACRGIIIKDGMILTSYETRTNQYMLPGGGKEANESNLDCVIREVKEETGYIIKPLKCALEINEYYGEEKYINKYFFATISLKTNTQLTEKEKEFGLILKWVNIQDLLNILSTYIQFKNSDEMRYGLYLRELTALKKILNK